MSALNNIYKLLLERNYYYSIPKDKELIMYDFYIITHLNALKNDGKFEPGDKVDPFGQIKKTTTHSMGVDENTLHSFEEIKAQILDYLKEELLEAAMFSVSCELRHLFDNNSDSDIRKALGEHAARFFQTFNYNLQRTQQKRNTTLYGFDDIIKARKREAKKKYNLKSPEDYSKTRNADYVSSYIAFKKTMQRLNISEYDAISLAKAAFTRSGKSTDEEKEVDFLKYGEEDKTNWVRWSPSYGGRPWYNIADAYLKLYAAKTEMQKIIYIDNMYHQQHNSDTVFNKLQSYYKTDGHRWILKALNFKADVKDEWDRIAKIRSLTSIRGVDKMYIELYKAAGEKTWTQYYKTDDATTQGPLDPNDILKKLLYIGQNAGIIRTTIQNEIKELYSLGMGNPSTPLLTQLKTLGEVDKPDILVNTKGSWDPYTIGADASKEYGMYADKWKELIGNKTPKVKDSEEVKDPFEQPSIESNKFKIIEYFRKVAKEQKDIKITYQGEEYISIGNGGTHDELTNENGETFEGLLYALKVLDSDINSHDLIMSGDYDITSGKWLHSAVGSDSTEIYALKKTKWESLFGEHVIQTRAETGELAKYTAFAEQGYEEFSHIPEISSGRYVFIGPGNPNTTGKIVQKAKYEIPNTDIGTITHSSTKFHIIPTLVGNNGAQKFFITKAAWKKVFKKDPPSKKTTAKQNTLSDDHDFSGEDAYNEYSELAKEGLTKFSHNSQIANGEYVFIGKGSENTKRVFGLVDKLLGNNNAAVGDKTSNGLSIYTNLSYSQDNFPLAYYAGTDSGLFYFIHKDNWNKIFKKPEPSVNKSDIEKYKKYAQEGIDAGIINSKSVSRSGEPLVYIGPGVAYYQDGYSKGLSNILNVKYTDLYEILSDGSSGVNNNVGNVEDWNYAIPHSIWKDVFGEDPPVIDSVQKDNKIFDSFKNSEADEKYTKIAHDFVNNVQNKYPELDATFVQQILDQTVICIGLGGREVQNIFSIVKKLSPGYYGYIFDNPHVTLGTWEGTVDTSYYFIGVEMWEKVFGTKYPKVSNSTDQTEKAKTNSTLSPATIRDAKNLAKEGYKMFNNTAFPSVELVYKPENMPLVYIGKGILDSAGLKGKYNFPEDIVMYFLNTIDYNAPDLYTAINEKSHWDSVSFSWGKSPKDYYAISRTDWKKVFGTNPPVAPTLI